ncbi:2-oxo acid dehydrogenase subunit E2 [Candidatus Binatia bacterium]|nr:2-oxo acid dehydrogenase subunit E2 [Candidatus Binatia bacterium]
MPKFGLTMQEGRIQQWFKAEGEPVAVGDKLFEVETEKVLYEVEATVAGTLARILHPIEAVVPCAGVVAVIALPGEDPVAVAAAPREAAAAPTPPTAAVASAAPGPPTGGAPATPAARKLAREKGVDLARVAGTGPGGRITREDVEAALTGGQQPAPGSGHGEPLRGMRKTIADRMLSSLQTTAQLTITTEADVGALVARRQRLQAEHPLTYTDLLTEAVARALREHPRLNATTDGERVSVHDVVHLGVAIALDDGLVVGVIRAADRQPLHALAAAARGLAERARAGTLGLDDVTGGTFTITNLGAYGVDAFTPILHTPQVAILGVGRIVEKPVVRDGQIVIRPTMVLSLTFDHRIIDGAPAARFLQRVVELLG